MTRALVVAVVFAACAPALEDTRLASLPRVPADPVVPQFPPELQGITFRTVGRMDEIPPPEATMDRLAACVDSFEEWMSAAGWRPIRDAQPVDVVVEEHCASRVVSQRAGDVIEMRHAETETVAVVVERDGVPLVTVPRIPPDYVCDSTDARQCASRAERWARANIISTLSASAPLLQLAQKLHPR